LHLFIDNALDASKRDRVGMRGNIGAPTPPQRSRRLFGQKSILFWIAEIPAFAQASSASPPDPPDTPIAPTNEPPVWTISKKIINQSDYHAMKARSFLVVSLF
jgi:hypothetical protein